MLGETAEDDKGWQTENCYALGRESHAVAGDLGLLKRISTARRFDGWDGTFAYYGLDLYRE